MTEIEDAIEIDVDAIFDGKDVVIGGIIEYMAQLAAKVMTGRTLKELGFIKEKATDHLTVKEAVFPFS